MLTSAERTYPARSFPSSSGKAPWARRSRDHARGAELNQLDLDSIGDDGEISLDFDVLSDKVSEMEDMLSRMQIGEVSTVGEMMEQHSMQFVPGSGPMGLSLEMTTPCGSEGPSQAPTVPRPREPPQGAPVFFGPERPPRAPELRQ